MKSVFQTTIRDAQGNVVPNTCVEFRNPTTGLLTSVWKNQSGTESYGNPVWTDNNGFLRVYLTPGIYNITSRDGPMQLVWNHVQIYPYLSPELLSALNEINQTPKVTGSFTTNSLTQNSTHGIDISHGLGTDNVIVSLIAKGNGASTNVKEQWQAFVKRPDEVCVAFFGPSIQAIPDVDLVTSPSAGNIRIAVKNVSATTQTITVYYEIRSLD